MASLTNFPNGVESAVGFFGPINGNASIGVDQTTTLTINSLTTIPLAALPAYADQAAASAALAPGQLFRFNTTGALGVALA